VTKRARLGQSTQITLSASLPILKKEGSPTANDDIAVTNQPLAPLIRKAASKSFRIIGLVIIAGKLTKIQKYSLLLPAGPSALR
jgi:hypothetical protein